MKRRLIESIKITVVQNKEDVTNKKKKKGKKRRPEVSLKRKITEIIQEKESYYDTITKFYKKYNDIMEVLKYEKFNGNKNDNNNQLENIINHFEYNDKTNDFLHTYYYNNKRYIFEEIILTTPEIYYIKTYKFPNNSFYDFIKFSISDSLITTIKQKIVSKIEKICYNAHLNQTLYEEIVKFILINNSIYDLSFPFLGEREILLINILRADEKTLKNLNPLKYTNYSIEDQLYIYSAFLRYNIITYLSTDNEDIKNNCKEKLEGCKTILILLKALMNKDKPIPLIDPNKVQSFCDAIENNTNENDISNLRRLIEIGTAISIFVVSGITNINIPNYFTKDKNYTILMYQYFRLFYLFINKTLKQITIAFSLLNAYGITFIPSSIKELSLLSRFNICLMNKTSLRYLNINEIELHFRGIFDLNCQNFYISYKTAFKPFTNSLGPLLLSIYEQSYKHLQYLRDPFLEDISDNQFYFYPMLYIEEFYSMKEQEKTKDNDNNKVEDKDKNISFNDFCIFDLSKINYQKLFDSNNNKFYFLQLFLSLFLYDIQNPDTLIHFTYTGFKQLNKKKEKPQILKQNLILLFLYLRNNWLINLQGIELHSKYDDSLAMKDANKEINIAISILEEKQSSQLFQLLWLNRLTYLILLQKSKENNTNFTYYHVFSNNCGKHLYITNILNEDIEKYYKMMDFITNNTYNDNTKIDKEFELIFNFFKLKELLELSCLSKLINIKEFFSFIYKRFIYPIISKEIQKIKEIMLSVIDNKNNKWIKQFFDINITCIFLTYFEFINTNKKNEFTKRMMKCFFNYALRKLSSFDKEQSSIMRLFSVCCLISSNISLENIKQFKKKTNIDIKKVVINNDSILPKYNPNDRYLIAHEHFDNNQMKNKNMYLRKFLFNASYNNENEYLNDFLSIIKEDIS